MTPFVKLVIPDMLGVVNGTGFSLVEPVGVLIAEPPPTESWLLPEKLSSSDLVSTPLIDGLMILDSFTE